MASDLLKHSARTIEGTLEYVENVHGSQSDIYVSKISARLVCSERMFAPFN